MDFLTQRLGLREFRESDGDALFAIYGDAENRRYESLPLTRVESDQKLRLALADQRANPRSHYRWAITLPPSDEMRGFVALTMLRAEVRELEIGWAVRTADWGKGYASEAACAVLGHAFNHLHAHRIIAFCHADNQRSMRVMAKLGMQPEALLRESIQINGEWCDERVYAILEREFFAQSKSLA